MAIIEKNYEDYLPKSCLVNMKLSGGVDKAPCTVQEYGTTICILCYSYHIVCTSTYRACVLQYNIVRYSKRCTVQYNYISPDFSEWQNECLKFHSFVFIIGVGVILYKTLRGTKMYFTFVFHLRKKSYFDHPGKKRPPFPEKNTSGSSHPPSEWEI